MHQTHYTRHEKQEQHTPKKDNTMKIYHIIEAIETIKFHVDEKLTREESIREISKHYRLISKQEISELHNYFYGE